MMLRPLKASTAAARPRSAWLAVALVCAASALAIPLAHAADLSPEPTTKTGLPAEPTSKDLTPTPALTPGTPTAPKPKPTAVPTAAPDPTAEPSAEPSASGEPEPSGEPAPSSEPAPSASAAPVAGPFSRRKVPLGVGDLEVSFSIPEAWQALPESALPAIEEASDVAVIARAGFGVHDPKGKPPVVREVLVVCGKAAGEFWADAIRDAAFTQMTAAVEKEAARYTTLGVFEPEPIRVEGDRFLQSFATEAELAIDGKAAPAPLGKGKPKAATTVKLQGLSFIGFHAEAEGETPDIVACSVACAQLVADGETALCPSAIGSIEISGNFAAPPKRSAIAELLFKLKSDPTTFWLVIIGAVFVVLGAILGVVVAVRRKKAGPSAGHDEPDDDAGEYDAGYQAGLAAANAASEIRSTMQASAPPPEGYFDPQTLTRRKV